MMTVAPIWKFSKKVKSEKNVGFGFESYFNTEDLGGYTTTALVREIVQNSLDAKLDENKPVRIRFFLSGHSNAVPVKEYNFLLSGLLDHIEVVKNSFPTLPDFQSPMSFLLIEDFNTRGLEGDTHVSDEEGAHADQNGNSFYYFWRNWGISGKQEGSRGQWGMGKTVFPKSSKMRTFFGLTVRKQDCIPLLMGQIVLKQHKLLEFNYSLFGDFGIFSDKDDEFFVLPIDEENYIDRFSQTFNLDRRDEPGLSIIIPYPDEDICCETLVIESIMQFFYAIQQGILEISIEHENKNYIINKDSLIEIISNFNDNEELIKERVSKEKLLKMVDFTRKALSIEESSIIPLYALNHDKKPDWKKMEILPENLESWQRRFETSEIMGFKICLFVKKLQEKLAKQSYFTIFLNYDPNFNGTEHFFIRNGIIIPKAGNFGRIGMRALVLINDAPLSTFLGDAENPAHTQWQQNSEKFKGQYEYGPSTLSFIKGSLNELYYKLNKPRDQDEPNLLIDIFSIEPDSPLNQTERKSDKDKKGDRTTRKEKLDIKSKTRLFDISSTELGSLKIKNKDGSSFKNKKLEITFAYDTRIGNPFSHYRSHDFDLSSSSISIHCYGGKILNKYLKKLEVEIHDDSFEILANGFDFHRDLKVRVREV